MITTRSAGAAVSLVEELLASRPADDTDGVVLELDIAVLDTADMDLPKPIEELAAAGIHFESGRELDLEMGAEIRAARLTERLASELNPDASDTPDPA